jgi:protein O-mannosyl-transferase
VTWRIRSDWVPKYVDRVLHYNEDGPGQDGPAEDSPAKAGHYVRNSYERNAYVRNRAVVACGVAALLGGVVYLNALRNPFVYDDHHTVVENASIAHVTDIRAIVFGALTRPIVNGSYAIDRAMWGATPLGFHVTNVLLHMLNVVLLFQLARRFGKDDFTAFAAAALFAVHPMMTEAVGYISGRSEVLCATFFMLALMSGRKWIADPAYMKWAVLTVGLWCAALATKESAAMFPFVFLAYDWLGAEGTEAARRRRLLTVHLPLIGAAVLAGIVRLLIFARIEYVGQTSIHWNYVLLELDVVRRYVWMMFHPAGQTIFHEVAAVGLLDPRLWLATIVLGLILAAAWTLRRVDWVASFGLLWFLLLLVPSSALIALDQGEPMAEHRVYLASCGIFLTAGAAIGWLGAWVSRVKGPANRLRQGYGAQEVGHYVRGVALALVLIAFGTETMLRTAVWADPVALWRESVDLAPAHYRPRLLLGEALQVAGRRDEAIEQYQTAIRLRPAEPTGYVKMGQCLAEIGQWAEARRQFFKAIDLDPQNRAARDSLIVLNEVESRFGINGSRR